MPHRVFIRVAGRVGTGIKEHFPIRVSEWVMLLPFFGMALVLRLQPDMFTKSGSFSTLSRWGSEEFWSFLCIVCGSLRLIALVVNGTFSKVFPYSPHFRMLTALVALVFWSQYSLAILDAYFSSNGALSGVIPYTTFVVFELVNFWRSNVDRHLSAK